MPPATDNQRRTLSSASSPTLTDATIDQRLGEAKARDDANPDLERHARYAELAAETEGLRNRGELVIAPFDDDPEFDEEYLEGATSKFGTPEEAMVKLVIPTLENGGVTFTVDQIRTYFRNFVNSWELHVRKNNSRRRRPEEMGLGAEASSPDLSSASHVGRGGGTPDMVSGGHGSKSSEVDRQPRERRPDHTPDMVGERRNDRRSDSTPHCRPPDDKRTRADAARSDIAAAGDAETAAIGAPTATLEGSPDAPADHVRWSQDASERPPTRPMFHGDAYDAGTTSPGRLSIDAAWLLRYEASVQEAAAATPLCWDCNPRGAALA
jgi:hypothetical protein